MLLLTILLRQYASSSRLASGPPALAAKTFTYSDTGPSRLRREVDRTLAQAAKKMRREMPDLTAFRASLKIKGCSLTEELLA